MSHENLMALLKSPTGKPNKWKTLAEYVFSSVDKVPVWAQNGTGSIGKSSLKINSTIMKWREKWSSGWINSSTAFWHFSPQLFLAVIFEFVWPKGNSFRMNHLHNYLTATSWAQCKEMDINTQAAKPNKQKKPNQNLLKPHIKVIQTQKSSHTEKTLRSPHFSFFCINF